MANPPAITVQIPTRQIKRALAVANFSERFAAIKKTPKLKGREEIWTSVGQRIGRDTEVLLLEFGVFKGNSMRFWISQFANPNSQFHGFDSFAGLPEDWVGKMVKGAFDTQGQVPDIDDSRVSFHVGWIQNTLPTFVRDHAEALKSFKNVIVHVDVDLYSAALFVLATLWHSLDTFYLVFDEFAIDENLALADFSSAFPIKCEFYSHVLSQYGMPSQVFCKVDRIPYTPD